METEAGFRELAPPAFVCAIPALLRIYDAAMSPPSEQLAGRHAIMEQHAELPGFASVVATLGHDDAVGFAYGFHGQHGQWWHDIVTAFLREHDAPAERRWFSDTFEIAEIHVHPRWQGRGIGRDLLRRLTAVRSERTAVLSTHAGESPAHRLYRSSGFVDVVSDFRFPGSPDSPFTIMAARLPLSIPVNPRDAGRSPGSPWSG